MIELDGHASQCWKLQVKQQKIIIPALELTIIMGKELAKWERSYLISSLRLKTLV